LHLLIEKKFKPNKIMKRLVKNSKQLLFGSLTIIAIVFLACTGFSNEEGKTPTIVKTFSIDTPGALEVKTSGGGIKVEGTEGNQVEVQVFVRKMGRLLDSNNPLVQDLEEGYDLTIEQHGNTVVAIAKRLNNIMPWKQISVGFKVYVPYDMACDLNTSGGGIKLANVNGIQTVNTSGGGIKLSNINGNTKAHTSGGGIKATNMDGETDLHTSGGGITISDAKGDMKAHTSGGGITLENIFGSIDAHTSGGGIRINGEANYVKATTSGGSINVDITGLNKELYLDTSGGGIHASIPGGMGMDLNLKANKVNMYLENFTGYNKKGKIEGSINGGGIPVYMHTSGGNINVDFN